MHTIGVVVLLLFSLICCGNSHTVDLANNTLLQTTANEFNITTKNFQLNFLQDLIVITDRATQLHLNNYLQHLHNRPEYAAHIKDFQEVEQSTKVKHKIVFIKQLLDKKLNEGKVRENADDMQTLRNVIFLKKLKHHFHEMHEEKIQEMRKFRMFEVCRQFKINKKVYDPPYSPSTPLAAMPTKQPEPQVHINLVEFGQELYNKVKHAGSEIINEYLLVIRKLLHEVIEEKQEDGGEQPKISKFLNSLDGILRINDFNQKRQQLYAYLGQNITTDYESFKNSEQSGQDILDVMAKLKQKGFDLFVNFLFSNFEFLEDLHRELFSSLEAKAGRTLHANSINLDENATKLLNIHYKYNEFKKDSENEQKYDSYLSLVKDLHAYTAELPEFKNVHIFELLRESSENVGSVTLNMIRAKCAEL